MLKKISIFILGIIFLGIFGLLGTFVWWNGVSKAPSNEKQEKRVVITKGSSIQKIGNTLAEAGVIKNANAFKIYVQVRGLTNEIPAGQFSLASNLTLPEVVEELLKGPTQVWVTIPEGLRREEIAEKVVNALEIGETEKNDFITEFMNASREDEGYLFPDTYLFPRDASATNVVSILRNTFDKKFDYNGGELSLDEVVTLASIIERETLTAEERPIVAGIYMNRINGGWSLDADATLQYAWATKTCQLSSAKMEGDCVWWPRPITAQMKDYINPYNTYKNAGLPPAPISNPGLTSLEAAANPTKTDYWFYIHDADGKIHYAKTIEEHNANVSKYLR
jgi:UPF0755 protein